MKNSFYVITFFLLFSVTVFGQKINFQEVYFEVDSIAVDTFGLLVPDKRNYSRRDVYHKGDIIFSQEFRDTNSLRSIYVNLDSVGVFLFFDYSGYCVREIAVKTPKDTLGQTFKFWSDFGISWVTDGFIIPNGTEYRYSQSGGLVSEATFVNGLREGTYKEYHTNGNVSFKQEFEKDKLIGLEQNFYEDGSIRWQYHYKDGQIDGNEVHYNRDGTIRLIKVWKEGELVEEIEVGKE